MSDFLTLSGGRPRLTAAASVSSGATDAGRIVKLDDSGKLDPTMMPLGVTADARSITASEAIAARDMVNISATGQIRKADASNDRPAHGFVTSAIASGASGTVFFEGVISGFSGLTVGSRYFLSDAVAGSISLTAPTNGSGKISQEIGVAVSATEISFEPQSSILLG